MQYRTIEQMCLDAHSITLNQSNEYTSKFQQRLVIFI